ncbi:MAG: hypothetical protein RIC35_03735 [Marinoscillum sp.]
MDITNPAVTDGVNLFVNIVVTLIAFGAAVSLIDFRKSQKTEK